LLGKWSRKCSGERSAPCPEKKEEKVKVPNPVLSLEEIEKGKTLSVETSSKRRRNLTAEKKFDLFVESCRSPGRIGEILRREGL
jgi:hypothetical protein